MQKHPPHWQLLFCQNEKDIFYPALCSIGIIKETDSECQQDIAHQYKHSWLQSESLQFFDFNIKKKTTFLKYTSTLCLQSVNLEDFRFLKKKEKRRRLRFLSLHRRSVHPKLFKNIAGIKKSKLCNKSSEEMRSLAEERI